ncbi:MAG: DUF4340 domain-containing protein [Sedimentisphaerales bacterium]|nr:DUF4340 domain-containing protein [Sedimentisphaerales bacterium]
MSNKNLTILGIVAILMLAAAVGVTLVGREKSQAPLPNTYLIPGLQTQNIAKIVLTSGGKPVTLKLEGEQFVIVEKSNYPAKLDAIEKLFNDCMGIKIGDLITDNPANHADLGVTEDKAKTVVRFYDKTDALITGLIIGNSAEDRPGTYIRLNDQDKVYLCERAPYLRANAADYMDQQLTQVERDAIVKVKVTGPDGTYALTRNDEGKVTLDSVPEGKQPKDSELENVFTVLTGLRFTDVTTDTAGLTFDYAYFCRLSNATEYTFKLAKKDDKTYLTAMAAYTGAVPKGITRDEPEEELKKKEAQLEARDAAEKFNQRHTGWIYEIGNWQAGKMTKSLNEVVEDIPKPEEKTEENNDTPVEPQPDAGEAS